MAAGRSTRTGAYMSTKVLARAACEGRHLGVLIAGFPAPIRGYLVGMDDFHLQIATISDDDVTIALIHKTAGAIMLSSSDFLKHEPEAIRSKVQEIGQPFWNFCERNYLGKSGGKESQ